MARPSFPGPGILNQTKTGTNELKMSAFLRKKWLECPRSRPSTDVHLRINLSANLRWTRCPQAVGAQCAFLRVPWGSQNTSHLGLPAEVVTDDATLAIASACHMASTGGLYWSDHPWMCTNGYTRVKVDSPMFFVWVWPRDSLLILRTMPRLFQ